MKMAETKALRSLRRFSQLVWTSRIWWGVSLVWGSAKSSAFLYHFKNVQHYFELIFFKKAFAT
jgi:hypothetical protein